jgi:hypothetical protein
MSVGTLKQPASTPHTHLEGVLLQKFGHLVKDYVSLAVGEKAEACSTFSRRTREGRVQIGDYIGEL